MLSQQVVSNVSIAALVIAVGVLIGLIVYVVIDSLKVDAVATGIPAMYSGFVDYNNTIDVAAYPAHTWVTVPNDGRGPFTSTKYAPSGAEDLMNDDGSIRLIDLRTGDVIYIRQDYEVTPTFDNSLLTSRYVLGSGQGEYTLRRNPQRLDDGATSYRFAASTDMIYVGDDNTRLNPVYFQIRCSSPFTLLNYGTAIGVTKYLGGES